MIALVIIVSDGYTQLLFAACLSVTAVVALFGVVAFLVVLRRRPIT